MEEQVRRSDNALRISPVASDVMDCSRTRSATERRPPTADASEMVGLRDPASHRAPSASFGLIAFALGLALLVIVNWDDLSQTRFEHGDFAANSILVDEAIDLELNHGNYSRAVFYHPGPALLYVQAAGQVMFFDFTALVPTPYNAHLLAILILNATMTALTVATLYRATGSMWLGALVIVFAFAYSLRFADPGLGGLLSSTWMPHVYVWPYLLMLVSAASVAAGSGADVWKLVLACGLLLHGHVAFVLPVLVFLLLTAGTRIRREGRRWLSSLPPAPRIWAGILVLVFLVPIVAQLSTDFPGQFDDYASYLGSSEAAPRTWSDSGRYLAQFWGLGSIAAASVPMLFIASFVLAQRRESLHQRSFILHLLSATLVATATTYIYVYLGVDDLSHTYLALFYVSVPILVWAVIGSEVMDHLSASFQFAGAMIFVASLLLIAAQPLSESIYLGTDVDLGYESASEQLPLVGSLAVSFPFDSWPIAVGFVEQARRQDAEVCARVDSRVLEILFTERVICKEDTAASSELYITSTDAESPLNSTMLYRGSFVIWLLAGR